MGEGASRSRLCRIYVKLKPRSVTELGALTRMRYVFDFDQNSLTGSIPSQFGRFVNMMTSLSLDQNTLSSTIPTELGGMVAM